MKVVAQPIEMVSWTDTKGNINPVRFRYTQKDESYITIKVQKVISKDLERLAGNYMQVFTCKTVINNAEKIFVLKYELSTCKWMLYKI